MPAIVATEVRRMGEQAKSIRVVTPEQWSEFYTSSLFVTELYRGSTFDILSCIAQDGREFIAVHLCDETVIHAKAEVADDISHTLDRRVSPPSAV